ncbi:hypothetical protein GCM10027515_02520 [Schumannella luteola]
MALTSDPERKVPLALERSPGLALLGAMPTRKTPVITAATRASPRLPHVLNFSARVRAIVISPMSHIPVS